MRKHFLTLVFIVSASIAAIAQGGKGIRIGYIDMEYILQSVPEYAEANNQLEQKAQKWNQEIEAKKNEITKLRNALNTEKVLLTKELIAEREEAITYIETEIAEYQQKRFGPAGDLITQKATLVKPIQDQVFNAVQDLAEAKKYDFIFDKSSDLTMLFAAKKFDISDQVIKTIGRASKRDQMTKKQLKEEAAKDAKETADELNPELAEKKQAQAAKQAEKQAAREKQIEDKKLAAEARKADAAQKRQELIDQKTAAKNGTTPTTADTKDTKDTSADDARAKAAEDRKAAIAQKIADREAAQLAAAEERAKKLEERKKALEEKKAKILADREAAKKEKEAKTKTN